MSDKENKNKVGVFGRQRRLGGVWTINLNAAKKKGRVVMSGFPVHSGENHPNVGGKEIWKKYAGNFTVYSLRGYSSLLRNSGLGRTDVAG